MKSYSNSSPTTIRSFPRRAVHVDGCITAIWAEREGDKHKDKTSIDHVEALKEIPF